MVFALDQNSDQPRRIGEIGEGWIAVQVVNGVGVYIGQYATGLRDSSLPGIDLYDGLFVTPADGIVKIPWSGEVWIFHPGFATTSVVGVIMLSGCES